MTIIKADLENIYLLDVYPFKLFTITGNDVYFQTNLRNAKKNIKIISISNSYYVPGEEFRDSRVTQGFQAFSFA